MIALLLIAVAWAHPLLPSGLEIDLDGGITTTWRTPAVRPIGVELGFDLPARCHPLAPATVTEDTETGTLVATRHWDCGPSGLTGATVEVRGLDTAPIDVVATARYPGGQVARTVLHGADDTWTLPEPGAAPAAFPSFLGLGIEHLLSGTDHVLFVLGLLLLVGPTRRLVAAATSFTAGHSVTLALAALGIVRLPRAPVETAIAASIVWLAVEVLGDIEHPGEGLLARHPGVLCAAFGLVHGLGFAGALARTGLPPGETVPALLGFNCGVEIGQLVVIGTALLAWVIVRRVGLARVGRALPAWILGAVASAWVWERMLG